MVIMRKYFAKDLYSSLISKIGFMHYGFDIKRKVAEENVHHFGEII